jgi:hypothetical protein
MKVGSSTWLRILSLIIISFLVHLGFGGFCGFNNCLIMLRKGNQRNNKSALLIRGHQNSKSGGGHVFPCPVCYKNFASVLALGGHKRYCKPGCRYVLGSQGGANAAASQSVIVGPRDKLNLFSSFLRQAGTLDNLPQPDDYGRMADMGDFEDYDHDQHVPLPVGRQHVPPDYYLLQDAKKWREEMNRTSPQPVTFYGRGIPSSFWLKKVS